MSKWKKRFNDLFVIGSDWKCDDCDECGQEVGEITPKQVKMFIEDLIRIERNDAYKKGVKDEIDCVNTSGEHQDIRKKLKVKDIKY